MDEKSFLHVYIQVWIYTYEIVIKINEGLTSHLYIILSDTSVYFVISLHFLGLFTGKSVSPRLVDSLQT